MDVVLIIALTVGLPIVIMLWAFSKFRGTMGSIKGGLPATAQIQSIAETGMTISSPSVGPEAPVYEMTLLVTPPGGSPYQAISKHAVPRLYAPMILPGRSIGVLVDPKNPQHVVPDWQRINDVPQAPGGFDAAAFASQFGGGQFGGGQFTAVPGTTNTFVSTTVNGVPVAPGTMGLQFDAQGNPNMSELMAFANATRAGSMPTHTGSAKELLATGTHGTAVVTSAMPFGKTVRQVNPAADPATLDDPIWVFTLEVELAGQAPFPAVFGHRVPVAKLALIGPGIRLAVAVNEADKNQEVAIDWDKSPLA